MTDNYIKDEKDEIEKKNKDIKNRSSISKNTQYKNNNNEDVKELNKKVKFNKLIFL